jgi:hypothetical protein
MICLIVPDLLHRRSCGIQPVPYWRLCEIARAVFSCPGGPLRPHQRYPMLPGAAPDHPRLDLQVQARDLQHKRGRERDCGGKRQLSATGGQILHGARESGGLVIEHSPGPVRRLPSVVPTAIRSFCHGSIVLLPDAQTESRLRDGQFRKGASAQFGARSADHLPM